MTAMYYVRVWNVNPMDDPYAFCMPEYAFCMPEEDRLYIQKEKAEEYASRLEQECQYHAVVEEMVPF